MRVLGVPPLAGAWAYVVGSIVGAGSGGRFAAHMHERLVDDLPCAIDAAQREEVDERHGSPVAPRRPSRSPRLRHGGSRESGFGSCRCRRAFRPPCRREPVSARRNACPRDRRTCARPDERPAATGSHRPSPLLRGRAVRRRGSRRSHRPTTRRLRAPRPISTCSTRCVVNVYPCMLIVEVSRLSDIIATR